jgi:hypothetical protein
MLLYQVFFRRKAFYENNLIFFIKTQEKGGNINLKCENMNEAL